MAESTAVAYSDELLLLRGLVYGTVFSFLLWALLLSTAMLLVR
jgi:hypothetical protein